MVCDNSSVYNRRNYTNPNIRSLYSTYIREYDIKAAGLNVLFREKAISENEYNYLSGLKPYDRKVRVGYILRDDKSLNKVLSEGLKRVMKEFMTLNNLVDSDILSIKNDAIFVINKRCKFVQFDNVLFRNKNTYTSYYNLNNIEFYYNKNGMDIKGINDALYPLHNDYMLLFLKEVFKMVETSSDTKRLYKKVTEFALAYMNRELDAGYYRELNDKSTFRTNIIYRGRNIGYSEFNGNIDDICIQYNYMTYIIPLMGILF